MKILDRYITITFLKNYLIGFMVLVGLYVVLDMVFNFDELARVQPEGDVGAVESALGLIRGLGEYYFYQMFLFFIHLSGIIPVVAAAFTLVRLSRFNELVALLAAGVPLLRVMAPMIVVGIALNVLLIVDQEVIVPRIIPQLVQKHSHVYQATGPEYPIQAMQDNDGGLLYAARYRPNGRDGAVMEEVDIIRLDERFQPISHITAAEARWDPAARQWRLTGGRKVHGLSPDQPQVTEQVVEIYHSGITPEEIAIYRSGDTVELLSTRRINQLLERPQSYGTTDLLRVKHSRITQPLANIILLLLAIGCVATREPGNLKTAAMKCLLVCGLCLAAVFLGHNLAGHPPTGQRWMHLWPVIMAWLPVFIFAPFSVWLLDRVKT